MPPATTPIAPVVIERTLPAAPGRVFAAFTDPLALKRWFCPGPPDSVVAARVDLRVGGAYAFELPKPGPDGDTLTVSGTYRRVDPPHRLEFTWAWDSPGWVGRESVVTLELEPVAGEDGAVAATRLRLTHADLLDEDARSSHTEGWNRALENLKTYGVL